jgi:hypothetical protein
MLLSLVVITVLVSGALAGTLADFSDSEEELGDTLQAGSLDLKVNGEDDPNVLPFIISEIVPDKLYDVTKTVANVGTIDGWLYLHLKNPLCIETNDKDLNGDGVIDELDKPEPEQVCEFGGKVGQQEVIGLGERCDMEQHISIEIRYDGVEIDLSQYDANLDGHIKLSEIACEQILIGQLEECGAEHTLRFGFWLQDVLDPTWPGDPKFSYWPTNCYQGDTVTFDVLFELLQTDYTPPGG